MARWLTAWLMVSPSAMSHSAISRFDPFYKDEMFALGEGSHAAEAAGLERLRPAARCGNRRRLRRACDQRAEPFARRGADDHRAPARAHDARQLAHGRAALVGGHRAEHPAGVVD